MSRTLPHPTKTATALLVGGTTVTGLLAAVLGLGAAQSTMAAAEPWHPVIEGLFGDRVVDIALTGNPPASFRSMLLLPLDRGLYVAREDGSGWDAVQVDSDRPAATVHAVTVARDDEGGMVVYAGLQGRTRFSRSEDGGLSWLARPGPVGIDRVDRLATSEATGRIYAAQQDRNTLYTSLDKGEVWAVHTLSGATDETKALFAAPDDPFVYMVRGERLYKTNDDPGHFLLALGPSPSPPVTAALRVDLAAVGPRGRLHAAGRTAGGAYRVLSSDDRGDTWSASGWPEAAAGVAPSALGAGEVRAGLSGVWLAVEDGRVFESSDRGASWEIVTTLPIRVTRIVVDHYNRDVWAGTDGLGLYRIKPQPEIHTGAVPVDAMAVESTGHEQGEPLRLLAMVLPERRDLTSTSPPVYGLFESSDGLAWTRKVLTTELGTNLLASPAIVHDRTLYSGTRISRDAGSTWHDLQPGPSGGPPSVLSVGPLTATLPVVYALAEPYSGGSTGSGLLLSEDGGVSWQETEAPQTGIVDLVASPGFPSDRTAVLATAGGFIHRAEDGLTFELVGRIPSYDPIERNVQDLAISPDFFNDGTVLAAIEDPLASPRANVYVSNNRGSTWQARTSGLDGSSRPRHISPSPGFALDRIVFLGGERTSFDGPITTIHASDAGGADWFPEAFMPPTSICSMAWAGEPGEGLLLAAAGQAGLWVRDLSLPISGGITPPAPSPTRTAGPSATVTGQPTATVTATATVATAAATVTATVAATATVTVEPTGVTATPSATSPATPSATATASATPSSTSTALPDTPVPSPSASASRTPAVFHTAYLPLAQKPR